MRPLIRAPLRRGFALASKLYPPLAARNLDSKMIMNSASLRAMVETGLIEYAGSPGLFHFLPLATRALEKLRRIICEEMDAIGAQRIQMPSLCETRLLEESGRLDAFGRDLFRTQDRDEVEFCLAPTHEESVTRLVADRLHYSSAVNATPILLYQMTSKFRDEMQPRYGLLRCREFLMKDLYTFDVDETAARKTYELCSEAYDRIFKIRLAPLKSPVMRVLSDVGVMGGSLSHEYHFENQNCGEDKIDFCADCNAGVNRELIESGDDAPSKCTTCGAEMKTFRTVEIAHTFLLGTKYSDAFNAYFTDKTKGNWSAYMGCYGIGVTRLLATLIDINLNAKKQIRWPTAITPYTVCLIPPKAGSKEETAGATAFAMDALDALSRMMRDEIVLDDRTDWTVGHRLIEAKKVGYPYVVVANKSVVQESIPKFEWYDLTGEDDGKMELVTHEQLFSRLRELELVAYC